MSSDLPLHLSEDKHENVRSAPLADLWASHTLVALHCKSGSATFVLPHTCRPAPSQYVHEQTSPTPCRFPTSSHHRKGYELSPRATLPPHNGPPTHAPLHLLAAEFAAGPDIPSTHPATPRTFDPACRHQPYDHHGSHAIYVAVRDKEYSVWPPLRGRPSVAPQPHPESSQFQEPPSYHRLPRDADNPPPPRL